MKRNKLPPHMRFKSGRYYYDHGRDASGKRVWEALSKDVNEARKRWAQIEADKEGANSNSVAALIDEYARLKLAAKSKSTQQNRNRAFKLLKRTFGHLRPNQLQGVHIARYLETHRSPNSANDEIAALSVVLSFGVRIGRVDRNVCIGIKLNPKPKRNRYVEDWEFLAVKSIASEKIQAVMDFAYMTSLRESDILSLTVESVKPEHMKRKHAKTGYNQGFHVTHELREVIDRLIACRPKVAGFNLVVDERGRAYKARYFSRDFGKLITQALRQEVIAERFTFHDIRAKAATDADDAGLDAQRLLGHTDRRQTESYIRSRKTHTVEPLKGVK